MNPPVLTEEQASRMRAWIDALRSGDYPQTRKALRIQGHYCCLGVAVEKAIQQGCPVYWDRDEVFDGQPREGRIYRASSKTLLIPAVTQWFGFDTEYAKIQVMCHELGQRTNGNSCKYVFDKNHDWATCEELVKVEATGLNDVYGWNFTQIADAMERFYFGTVTRVETKTEAPADAA